MTDLIAFHSDAQTPACCKKEEGSLIDFRNLGQSIGKKSWSFVSVDDYVSKNAIHPEMELSNNLYSRSMAGEDTGLCNHGKTLSTSEGKYNYFIY